jgi:hypothetical protein
VRVVELAREPTLGEHGKEQLRDALVELDELVAVGKGLESGESTDEGFGGREAADVEPDGVWVAGRGGPDTRFARAG